MPSLVHASEHVCSTLNPWLQSVALTLPGVP